MEIITTTADAQRVSQTHCRLGLVALAKAGVRMWFSAAEGVYYRGTREAMVQAGVLGPDQLPGVSFVSSKRFQNDRGQAMKVTARGKREVEVFVRLAAPRSRREIDVDLDDYDYGRCLNVAAELMLRVAGAA